MIVPPRPPHPGRPFPTPSPVTLMPCPRSWGAGIKLRARPSRMSKSPRQSGIEGSVDTSTCTLIYRMPRPIPALDCGSLPRRTCHGQGCNREAARSALDRGRTGRSETAARCGGMGRRRTRDTQQGSTGTTVPPLEKRKRLTPQQHQTGPLGRCQHGQGLYNCQPFPSSFAPVCY